MPAKKNSSFHYLIKRSRLHGAKPVEPLSFYVGITTMERLNVEIKALCNDPSRIRERLRDKNAVFIGEDHQVDTYFRIPEGRLKLREGNIENALIHYFRTDQTGPKRSEVLLYRAQPGSALKKILETALGILVVVDKRRFIYFIENVKFHVDEVEGLGSFVEIEAIDRDGTIGEERLQEQCRFFMEYLNIQAEDLIDSSYSDLIIANRK